MVIAGEGRFDAQPFSGKVVGRLLDRAAHTNVRVGVIAGQIDCDTDLWTASLSELAGSTAASMSNTPRWLRESGALAAHRRQPNQNLGLPNTRCTCPGR